jgi:hypothetical protein
MPLIYDVYDASDPNGTKLGELTKAFDKQIRVEDNAYGSGSFSVNRHDAALLEATLGLVRHDLEHPGQLIKVKLTDAGGYIHAFWLDEGQDEVLSREESGGEVYQRAGKGVLQYLERAVVYPELHGAAGSFDADRITFTDETYGTILATLLDEALLRSPSPLEFLTYDFDGTNDSDGSPWDVYEGDFVIPVGLYYHQVMAALQSVGVHFKMTPNLVLQARASHGTDLSATLIFEKGVNIREGATRQVHGRPVRSRMLVQGANSAGEPIFEEATALAWEGNPRVRRREGFVSYGVTATRSMLQLAGAQAIDNLVKQREGSLTLGVKSGVAGEVPFTDYDEGDIAAILVPGEYEEDRRIITIILAETEAAESDDATDPGYDTTLEFHGVPFDPFVVGLNADKIESGANVCADCPPPQVCEDPYTRTVAEGGGTSPIGNAPYTTDAGGAGDPSGLISTTGSVLRCEPIDEPTYGDVIVYFEPGYTVPVELLVKFRLIIEDTLAVGDLPEFDLQIGTGTLFSETQRMRVRIGQEAIITTNLSMQVEKNITGADHAQTARATVITGGYDGEWLWVRFRCNPNEVKARCWKDGEAEPSSWQRTLASVETLTSPTMIQYYFGIGSSNESVAYEVDTLRITEGCPDRTLADNLAGHLSDTSDAHDASAVSFVPAGTIAATNVQDAIEEVAAEATGAPTTADYLVGTAQAGLSAEIVVGTTPGGELGGTWAAPTVDATHSGSAHHAQDHASRHVSGGADSVKLDDLATPDDNTDLNASTTRHGLLRKLDNDATHYLDGQGGWTVPPGSGGVTEEDVRDAGRWEVLMTPGITSPPEPVWTPDGTDYVYVWVSG